LNSKNLAELEIFLEKLYNETYTKYIGIKNYHSLESLSEDWKKLEDEFMLLSEDNEKKYEILFKNREIRYEESYKKVLRNLKYTEEVY